MITVTFAAILGAGCSSSHDTPASDAAPHNDGRRPADANRSTDSSGPVDAPATAALTCASHTYCSSQSITEFNGQVLPDATGGTIPAGLYRTEYELSTFNDPGSTSKGTVDIVLISGSQYLDVGGIGELGTFTTAGTEITFTPSVDCDSATGSADATMPPARTVSYSVRTDGTLWLYSPNHSTVHVMIPVAALCTMPTSPATSPGGDTLACHVANCGCAENTNAPADSATCSSF